MSSFTSRIEFGKFHFIDAQELSRLPTSILLECLLHLQTQSTSLLGLDAIPDCNCHLQVRRSSAFREFRETSSGSCFCHGRCAPWFGEMIQFDEHIFKWVGEKTPTSLWLFFVSRFFMFILFCWFLLSKKLLLLLLVFLFPSFLVKKKNPVIVLLLLLLYCPILFLFFFKSFATKAPLAFAVVLVLPVLVIDFTRII